MESVFGMFVRVTGASIFHIIISLQISYLILNHHGIAIFCGLPGAPVAEEAFQTDVG